MSEKIRIAASLQENISCMPSAQYPCGFPGEVTGKPHGYCALGYSLYQARKSLYHARAASTQTDYKKIATVRKIAHPGLAPKTVLQGEDKDTGAVLRKSCHKLQDQKTISAQRQTQQTR